MASRTYNEGTVAMQNGTDDFLTDAYTWILVNSAYTHDPDHQFISTIVANEISVAGYSRAAAASKTVTKDTTNDRDVFDTADPSFGSALAAGQTMGGAVLARNTGVDATSRLVAFVDDVSNPATNGGAVTLTVPTTGAFYLQV